MYNNNTKCELNIVLVSALQNRKTVLDTYI